MKLRTLIKEVIGCIWDIIMMELHRKWAFSLTRQYHDLQKKMGYPEGYPHDGMQEIEHKYNPNLRVYRLKAIYHFRKNQKYYARLGRRQERLSGDSD